MVIELIILVIVKYIGAFLGLVLILYSLTRIPEKNIGLAANKMSFLGSPSSAQRSLDIAAIVCIFIYLTIAFILDIMID